MTERTSLLTQRCARFYLLTQATMTNEFNLHANQQYVKESDFLMHNDPPPLLWQRHVSVPFSYALSKNAMFIRKKNGQVSLSKESRLLRSLITRTIRNAAIGQKIAHNKVWVSILVQKPDHKGDAVNVVDLVCDALKDALPVDDRWFCIRILDWHINKINPKLHISFGQCTDVDAQVCSQCGLIKPLDQFSKSKRYPLGVGYMCKACRRASRKKEQPA